MPVIMTLSKHAQYKKETMLIAGRYCSGLCFTYPMPSFVAAQMGIL